MKRLRRPARFPLALQLLTGLLLNFVLVLTLFAGLPGHGGTGWDLLLTATVRERLLSVGDQLAQKLAVTEQSQWPALLEAEGRQRGLAFEIRRDFREGPPGGPPPSGRPPSFDGERRPSPEDGPHHGDDLQAPPDVGRRGPPPPQGQTDRTVLADMIAIQRSGWGEGFSLRIPMQVQGRPVDLQVQADGAVQLLRLLGVADWLLFAAASLVVTALIWTPFAWRLARAIGALTEATGRIAQGQFDVRLPPARRDELGTLADSIGDMAARLRRQVETQKQFVADVAHEVTAPLARLRVGLELLDAAPVARRAAVQADLRDDAEQMSALLDELLMFSRTGQVGQQPAAPCALAELVRAAIEQEAGDGAAAAAIHVDVPARMQILVPAALAQRAVANLVRNALRYGREKIEVFAEPVDGFAQVHVRDRGPGVPEDALARLGEPFYRPDFARNRDHGGTGLGLAIVRRCAEAFQGSVEFRNRPGGGFEAVLSLPVANG